MRICMPAYTFYETDNRVRRYAETLVRRGDAVDVVALRRDNNQRFEKINGVNVYKVQKRKRNEKSPLAYFFKIFLFLINSTLIIARNHLREPYDLVHVHSLPDFEVFAALLPRLAGTKVILDIHDLVPEFFKSKFSKANGSLLYNGLLLLEKASIAFSNHVIISNHLWYNTLVSRSVDSSKCTVLLNYPDNTIFYKRNRTLLDDKMILMYPGVLSWHQGLDIAIKAFAKIKDKVPKAEFHIYGSGPIERHLGDLIIKLGIEESIESLGLISQVGSEACSSFITVHFFVSSSIFMLSNSFFVANAQGILLSPESKESINLLSLVSFITPSYWLVIFKYSV